MKEAATPLWTLDYPREPHFDEPSTPELTAHWLEAHPTQALVLPDAIYGIAEVPEAQPTAIVSLDLDEIVRMSGLSLIHLRGGVLDDMVTDGARGHLDYGSHLNGWEDHDSLEPQAMRHLMLQELMHAGRVPPVEYHSVIATFLREWRAQDVYTIVNTSTLSGCELSTIKFLDEHFPGCTQGLLLPRNHDGHGSVTKAQSLRATLQAINEQTAWHTDGIPVIAIDDASHHAQDYDKAGIKTFMPSYDWNTGCQEVGTIERIPQHWPGTVDTFVAVDRYLTNHL